jgi:RimJ/RimL family protein N-acetyltransferase
MKKLETDRLILRQWRDSDIPIFAKMNRDPKVMEFFPALLSEEEAENFVARIRAHFQKHGYGLFAVELKNEKTFIGFVGLSIPQFEAPFMPAVEIGWRISSQYFGQGYATEAAKKILGFAFNNLKLKEVVSFTVPENKASRRVMEKIGMKRDLSGDFFHPKLEKDHPFSLHVLYRIKNPYLAS